MKELSNLQIGYLAAMFDGEGNFTLGRFRQKCNGRYTYNSIAGVGNTKLPLLTYLQQITGLGDIRPRADGGPRRARSWYWALRVEEQKQLIPVILPYLVIKQTQASLFLEYFETVKVHTGPGYCIDDDTSILRACIFDELAVLNKRGPC